VELLPDPVEIRAIGALVEKQVTTPEYYPLTLNALVNACNQTTNRDPVTSYDASTVERALESLRQKGLIWSVRGGRALKYEQRLSEKLALGAREMAVLCVLMLRGPQTAGEIRGRTGRLHEFASLEEVEPVLHSLMSAEPPLAIKLPRAPGTKEARFAHLLGGEPPVAGREPAPPADSSNSEASTDGERIGRLEAEIQALRLEFDELRRQFDDLKRQFE